MKNSGVEWIGEIPEDWEVKPLTSLFSFGKGLPITKEDLKENGIPVLSYGQIHSKTNTGTNIQNDLLRYVDESYLVSNPQSLVQRGDFIFADTSEDLDGCGNCAYVNFDSKLFAGYHTVILKSKDCSNNQYLAYLFKTDEWRKQIRAGLVEVKLYSISRKVLKKASVILPPKSTQQRIASYLDKKCSKIEETIQKQQQVIEKLKAYKQSLITEAVTGKIKIQNGKVCGKYESYKDSGVEYLGKIPSNWNIKRLRYIGKCQNGISNGGEFFGSGYPFVSYGDVYNNLTLPETVSGLIESTPEEQENYSVMAGDIFFTRTSETIEEVGFTSVCLKTIEKATFAGFVIRVRPFTDELIPDYSKYYFSSDAHRRFFVKEMNLVTRASLSQDLLKRLPVLIPSKEGQKSIADYLDKKCTAIDTAIEQKQKLIEKLTEYKKSLIYECVTGKKEI